MRENETTEEYQFRQAGATAVERVLAELRQPLATFSSVALLVGLNRRRVAQIAESHGVSRAKGPPRGRESQSRLDVEDVRAKVASGWTDKEIGKNATPPISRAAVCAFRKKHGILARAETGRGKESP